MGPLRCGPTEAPEGDDTDVTWDDVDVSGLGQTVASEFNSPARTTLTQPPPGG